MAKIYLKRAEARVLEDRILDQKDHIESGKWSLESFTEDMVKRMKRPLTVNNVRGAATTMGVKFKRSSSGNNGGGLRNYNELRSAVKILARELVTLKGELASDVSPILQAMADYSTDTDDS